MTATATANGKPQRKQLTDQLDRLDSIIDALAEALPEAVADACRQGARQAVKDAVVEILASPELRTLITGLAAARVAPPAPAPATLPTDTAPAPVLHPVEGPARGREGCRGRPVQGRRGACGGGLLSGRASRRCRRQRVFSDIAGNRILKMDVNEAVTTFRADSGRTNGNCFDAAGGLVSCEGGEQVAGASCGPT